MLYDEGKESSLMLLCINITDDAICGTVRKVKRILIIQAAYFFVLCEFVSIPI